MPESATASARPDDAPHNIDAREPISCERCKARKLRCDRQRPSCNRCLKFRTTCTYSGRKKPGFPAGERQALEDKIKRLEEQAQRARESTRSSGETASASHTSMSQAVTTDKDTEVQPIATLEKTRRVVVREPPADLVLSSTSLFFRHIHPWLPFLDTERVLLDLGSMQNTPLLYYALFGVSIPYSYDPRLDHRSSDSFWTYSKRRIFVDMLEEPSLKSLEALTILILDLSGMTNGAQVWGALSIAVKFSIQLKFIGDRVFRTCAGDDVDKDLNDTQQMHRRRLFWAIYALDSYITITTGHSSDLDASLVSYFLPSRESTWRGSQVLLPSSAQGNGTWRASEELDFLTATPTFVFSYQLELLDLSRQVHEIHLQWPSLSNAESLSFHNFAQDFLSCSTGLSQWLQNLPICLALNLQGVSQPITTHIPPTVLMLHAYYHALVLHLHGLSAYPPDEACQIQLGQQKGESNLRCIQSVAAISTIVSRYVIKRKIYDRLGWPFAWTLWIACRHILLRNRYEDLHDTSVFDSLLDCLKKYSRFCQIGGKYWRLLRQAMGEFGDRLQPGHSQDEAQVVHNVLDAVTDLRLSTSDLEDRSRPDPIIYTAIGARRASVHIEQMMYDFEGSEHMRNEAFHNTLLDKSFLISDMAADSWFGNSLFATSGYQQ